MCCIHHTITSGVGWDLRLLVLWRTQGHAVGDRCNGHLHARGCKGFWEQDICNRQNCVRRLWLSEVAMLACVCPHALAQAAVCLNWPRFLLCLALRSAEP